MQAMMNAVTDRSLLPVVCPVFIHSDDRIDRILELCEQCAVDGLVYHITRLCAPFDFEDKKVAAVAAKKGIPILKLETEYGEEDAEQLRTRVEAFLEVLKSKR
jgi:benzoyl-CoA reductase/2-hydroxyglutaryl-CoA dehydratase subunit BcrC/BadD/HgdB